MAKYPLTEKQKDMLTALVPQLRDHTIKADWFIVPGDNGIVGIVAPGSTKSMPEIWLGISFSDFDSFVNCGLFNRIDRRHYSLNEALILDAVDRDFEVNNWARNPSHVNRVTISGGDFRGAFVNAASTLNHVQQSIGSAPQLSDDAKAQLTQLMEQLKDALANANLSESDAEEADILAHHAQTAVEQLSASKPNKKLFSMSVDGLVQAANNIGRVAVPVAAIAVKIAMILRSSPM